MDCLYENNDAFIREPEVTELFGMLVEYFSKDSCSSTTHKNECRLRLQNSLRDGRMSTYVKKLREGIVFLYKHEPHKDPSHRHFHSKAHAHLSNIMTMCFLGILCVIQDSIEENESGSHNQTQFSSDFGSGQSLISFLTVFCESVFRKSDHIRPQDSKHILIYLGRLIWNPQPSQMYDLQAEHIHGNVRLSGIHISRWKQYSIKIENENKSIQQRICSAQGLQVMSIIVGRLLVAIHWAEYRHTHHHPCSYDSSSSPIVQLLYDTALSEMEKSTVSVIQERMRNIAFHSRVCPVIPEALKMTEYQYLRSFHHSDFLALNLKLCEPHTAFINASPSSSKTEFEHCLEEVAVFTVLLDVIYQHTQKSLKFMNVSYLQNAPEYTIIQCSPNVFGWKFESTVTLGCKSILSALACFLSSNNCVHWLGI